MRVKSLIGLHTVAFFLALCILVALAWQGKRNQEALIDANQRVHQSLEVISSVQTVFSALLNIESGERGYVITGVPEYLEPYRVARSRLDLQRQELNALLQQDQGIPGQWITELNEVIETRLAISERNISIRAQSGLEAASANLLAAGGRQTTERLRNLVGQIKEYERSSLARESQELQEQLQRSRLLGWFGTLLLIVLFLGAFWAIQRNLLARLRLAHEAQASAARLDALLQAVPDTLYERDQQGHARLLSSGVADSQDDISPVIESAIDTQLEASPRDGLQQFNWEAPSGRTYEIRLVPTGMGDHLAIARDISEAERIDRMKTEFVSTVSHELRTPLTAIRGALGMLVNGMLGEVDQAQRPLLDIAHKNSERLVRLINDILDIEKLESGRLSLDIVPCQIASLLDQAVLQNSPYAQEYGVRLELDSQVGELRFDTDPDRFAQIMANLLSNAIKHSPSGGIVTVDVQRDGDQLEIGVADKGPGIPESFRPRIFERFSQADASDVRRLGGTGLGLAITRSLVEQMGGQIGFTTTLGEGTRFNILLPCPAAASPAPVVKPAEPQKRCILILEPDAAAAAQLEAILQRQGYATVTASSSAQAHELLTSGSYHALTLSPALQDDDCISFLQKLRERGAYRHLPVLVVSLNAELQAGGAGISGGAVGVMDWLHKPIDPSRVLEVVNACMHTFEHRPTILHVEDDEDLRTLMANLLNTLDINLVGAGSLAEAREQLSIRHHDLAILDLMLPDGDGSELIDELAQASPPTPVIIFSALDSPASQSQLVLRRLVKSRHDSTELAALIQQLLQHWPLASARPTDKETQ